MLNSSTNKQKTNDPKLPKWEKAVSCLLMDQRKALVTANNMRKMRMVLLILDIITELK